MRIKYKEPYWVMYKWDLDTHHDNQYVTQFNKTDIEEIKTFLYEESYIITAEIRLLDLYRRDPICTLFGKPGKNIGVTYNNESKILAFEFWTKGDDNTWDDFNFVSFNGLKHTDLNRPVKISIARQGNSFTLYVNFEVSNKLRFKNNLIDDYQYSGLFLGCANPGSPVEEHRHHGEYDMYHFSIVRGTSDIKVAKSIYETQGEKLISNPNYKDILCLYNFNTINNIGIIFDESKNNNFLEKVPEKFVL